MELVIGFRNCNYLFCTKFCWAYLLPYMISQVCMSTFINCIVSTVKKVELWEVVQAGDQPLGKGSYGEVVKVTYRGREYAAKKIRGHLVDNDEYFDKALHEFHILRDLVHPNIVQYYTLGKLHKHRLRVLVMELMTTDLHQYLEAATGVISTRKKKGLLNNVAKGLQYLHSKNVWHRDLTAKNVLLDDRGTAKISDFGNSRVVNSDSGYTQSTLTGMPGLNVYMPPEACQPIPDYSHSIDIFSFGHLGLFVLVQKFPIKLLPSMYKDAKGKLLVRDEVERREEYFAKIPPNPDTDQIVELVKKCLEFSPDDRPDIEDIIGKTK